MHFLGFTFYIMKRKLGLIEKGVFEINWIWPWNVNVYSIKRQKNN